MPFWTSDTSRKTSAHRSPFFNRHSSLVRAGFGKVEIVFAIALLIVGIFGIVLTIMVRRAPTITEAALMTPTMAIEELVQRLETQGVFARRIKAGNEWIHDENNSPAPIRIKPEGNYFWRCRASRNLMDAHSMLKDADPVRALPEGKYQIAILVYRDYQNADQPTVAEFAMVMSSQPPRNDVEPAKRDEAPVKEAAPAKNDSK